MANALYEALIEGIDPHAKIKYACRGRWQSYVESEESAGVASLLFENKTPYSDVADLPQWRGRSLRELAAGLGSEDSTARALAVAAMNAWYNDRNRLLSQKAALFPPESPEGDVFVMLAEQCRCKLVSTIGHFHGGETLRGMRELRVFEMEPRPGDLPAEEEERLLPESDIVIVTGMALTNGTVGDILRWSEGKYIALTGPSVPMTAAWFDFGVKALFGTLVWDVPGCRDAAYNGGHKETWKHIGKAVMRCE